MSLEDSSVINREIIQDNEAAAQAAYQRQDYLACFLIIHSLVESLLRAFLTKTTRESFNDLIIVYSQYLQQEDQQNVTFVGELTKLNQRRNRVVHELWKKGYTATNSHLEPACKAAFLVYGLLIEWLETFNPDITDFGFEYQ